MAKALFRCDASITIGSGHVMRCLTLADYLRERGWECVFATTPETLQAVSFLRDSGYRVISPQQAYDCDVVIIDHYGLDSKTEAFFKSFAKRIIVIDDLADRTHHCDVLIDQTFGREVTDYKNLVPAEALILTGTEYALLRPQFLRHRHSSLQRREALQGHVDRVIVMLGSIDPPNVSSLVLQGLAEAKASVVVDVVTGSGNPHLASLTQQIKTMGDNMHLHVDVVDMAGLMSQADLAIGAGGTSSWERACLGLPTLLIEIADNQKTIAANLDRQGSVMNLGWYKNLTPASIARSFTALCADPQKIKHMSHQAQILCNGHGASALAPALLSPFKTHKGAEVRLRRMVMDDAEILYRWQSYPETRRYARSPAVPEWNGHLKWMARALDNPDCFPYFIIVSGAPAGMLRLDRQADPSRRHFEVSILLNPDYYGQGVAAAALRLIRQLEINAVFTAEIHPDNHASHVLFEQAGFKRVDEKWFRQDPQ